MFKFLQGGLSAVAGTAEPEYGKEAIHPFFECLTPQDPVYRETDIKDFGWLSPGYTNVETQTFYFTDFELGVAGFAQVIHSSIMGVHTTAQFTFRLYNFKTHDRNVWTSTKLEDFRIEGSNFYAKDLSIEISEDNKTYKLKSAVTEESMVDLEIQKIVPGVIFGKDGTTLYGDDVENPWGSMRHVFWPRCKVTGTISLKEPEAETAEVLNINGLTMFVMALQGMKPHHAAKSWNFINFHSAKYSAIQMEFTTPSSYASTKVNVGIVSNDKKIVLATINNKVVHLDSEIDEIGWPVPKRIIFNHIEGGESSEASTTDIVEDISVGLEGVAISASTKESISSEPSTKETISKPTMATKEPSTTKEPTKETEIKDAIILKGNLDHLVVRVDVMAEIPQFIKNIVSGVAGAKPFIYQYCDEFELEGDHEGDAIKEKGVAFCEVTFISDN